MAKKKKTAKKKKDTVTPATEQPGTVNVLPNVFKVNPKDIPSV